MGSRRRTGLPIPGQGRCRASLYDTTLLFVSIRVCSCLFVVMGTMAMQMIMAVVIVMAVIMMIVIVMPMIVYPALILEFTLRKGLGHFCNRPLRAGDHLQTGLDQRRRSRPSDPAHNDGLHTLPAQKPRQSLMLVLQAAGINQPGSAGPAVGHLNHRKRLAVPEMLVNITVLLRNSDLHRYPPFPSLS